MMMALTITSMRKVGSGRELRSRSRTKNPKPRGAFRGEMKARFPWLGTDESVSGADAVRELSDWYTYSRRFKSQLKRAFPWLGTEESVSGADVIDRMNAAYRRRGRNPRARSRNPYYELAPAYGRDYKSAAEVKAAWAAGKDFMGDYQLGFKPVNINDIPKPATVLLRYARLTKVANVQVKVGQRSNPKKRKSGSKRKSSSGFHRKYKLVGSQYLPRSSRKNPSNPKRGANRIFEVTVPASASDTGYQIKIRAKTVKAAREEARRYCSKHSFSARGGRYQLGSFFRNMYKLPAKTKVKEVSQ